METDREWDRERYGERGMNDIGREIERLCLLGIHVKLFSLN